MGEAGRTAASKALIESELESLRWNWGDAYDIGHDERGWRALRRDGLGDVLTGATPRRAVQADHRGLLRQAGPTQLRAG